MTGWENKTGVQIGRQWAHAVADRIEDIMGGLFGLLFWATLIYAGYIYVTLAHYQGHHGLAACWHFFVHNWKTITATVLAIIATGSAIVFATSNLDRYNAWLGVIVAIVAMAAYLAVFLALADVALFGLHTAIARFITHEQLAFTRGNLLWTYPLRGGGLALVVGISLFLLTRGILKIGECGPSVPMGVIIYIALAAGIVMLVNVGAAWVDQVLDLSENAGLLVAGAMMVTITILVILFLLRRRTALRYRETGLWDKGITVVIYLARCAISVFDAVLASQIGFLAAGFRSPLLRIIAIVLLYAIPCTIAFFGAKGLQLGTLQLNPETILFWAMLVPCLITLGIYRRAAWLDEDRQRSLMTVGGAGHDSRLSYDDDLRVELLLCVYLLFFWAAPITLYVLNSTRGFFTFDGGGQPNFLDWVGFSGGEMIREIPLFTWLREAVNHHDANTFHPKEGAPPIALYMRLLAEVSILAIMFQTLNRSSADSRQREQFEDRADPISRLDLVAERDTFRAAGSGAWDVIEHLPRYDPHRLEAVAGRATKYTDHDTMVELLGAARIAGYQFAGGAIAAILRTPLPETEKDTADDILRDYKALDNLATSDDRPFRHHVGPKALTDDDPRRQMAAAALEGLDRKRKKLAAYAPEAKRIREALETFGQVGASVYGDEFQLEIDELKRKGEIESLLDDLEDDDYSVYYPASERLRELVNSADASLYRAMVKDSSPNRRSIGVTLLGALKPSLENEIVILELWKTLNYRPQARILRALARIGGQASFDVISQQSFFTDTFLKERFRLRGYDNDFVPAVVALALREPTIRPQAVALLQGGLAARHAEAVRYACLKGIHLLYGPESDSVLIDCAWTGFAGHPARSLAQVRGEERAITRLRQLAIRTLAQSRNNPSVVASLKEMYEVLDSDDKTRLRKDWSRFMPWHWYQRDETNAVALLKEELQQTLSQLPEATPPSPPPENERSAPLARFFLSQPETISGALDLASKLT